MIKKIITVLCSLVVVIALQSMANAPSGKFTLKSLAYELNALEPIISQKTLELHWGKHLQGYVNNLNKLVVGTKYENMTIEEICNESKGAIYNNAGQIYNHDMFFESLAPVSKARKAPKGALANAIKRDFGSFEAFKKEFTTKGATLFGSGWVWLSQDSNGKLVITQEGDADSPLTKGYKPLLCFDVWEHAYYVDYQNLRASFLNKIWDIVDWKVVERRFR